MYRDSVACFSDTGTCMCACVFNVIQFINNTELQNNVHDKSVKHNISDRYKQAKDTEDEKVEMLLEILQRQDHQLLPKFCEMLDKSHQRHIARLIRENVRKQEQQQQQQPGKHTSV